VAEPRWLLLGHQLPTSSSNARVKIWRRLQQVGAVPTRNSVYVLPNTEQCREDFEWIRSEIVALGGEATVFAADAISAGGADDIVTVFRRTREQEYRAVKAEIDRLLPTGKSKRRSDATREAQLGRVIRALRDRFRSIERIDFFDAPARETTAAALATLEASVARQRPAATPATPLSAVSFHGRRWVTRPRPGVDRMASAWLIRRFIDPRAVFGFTDQPGDDDVPFDMYTGDFSHQGDLCTFEVLVDRFGLTSPAVVRVGRIVHDLDMKDDKFGPPEAVAVGRLVEGLRASHADDPALLEQGMTMFEALARSFEADESGQDTRGMARRTARNAKTPGPKGKK
jgi:hypothetical protein